MHNDKKTAVVTRSILSAKFLLAVVIIVIAAAALRPGMIFLSAYYAKEAIDIQRPLSEFDMTRLPSFQGDWEYVFTTSKDDIETDEYARIHLGRKGAVEDERAWLFVTYYSDPNSKIPHTPEVCYRQKGSIIKKLSTILIDTPLLAPKQPQVKAKLLIMEDSGLVIVLIYCFSVEAQIEDSREQARWIVGKPGNRYTYFSKVETSVYYSKGDASSSDDKLTKSVEMCKKLFQEVFPILVKEYFPTSEQVRRN
ncbi:hypothetical protein ACFL3G_06860 [Planctomycetota bacterium]